MKNLVVIACTFALSLFSYISNAENTVYIGIAAGATSVSHDNIDEGTSSKFFIGFNPDNHVALEAAFYTTGEADYTLAQDVTVEADGLNASAYYVIPNEKGNMSVALGAGIYIFGTNVEDPAITGIGGSTEDSYGMSLHAHTQYQLFTSLALRADLDVFLGVEAFDENKAVTSLLLGAAYMF
jgi:hypothetical protein